MRHARALAPLVAVFALAACGGGGDDDGERLSKAELAERVNAICTRFGDRLEALPQPRSEEELADYARQSAEVFSDGLDELHSIEPPEDLEQRYGEWLGTGDDALDRLRDVEQAADAGDAARVRTIVAEAAVVDKRSDRLARELGFDACAD